MNVIKIQLTVLAALMVLGGIGMADTAYTTINGNIAASIAVSSPSSFAWTLGISDDNVKNLAVVVDTNSVNPWALTSQSNKAKLTNPDATPKVLTNTLQISTLSLPKEDIAISPFFNALASHSGQGQTDTTVTLHQKVLDTDAVASGYTATLTFNAGFS
jgi:hypothetical protein